MELKLVIFLAFTSVTVVANTLLLWFAYKGFADIVTRVSETAIDFGKNRDTAAVVNSLKVAAEQAVRVTEIAREKLIEFDPVLDKAASSWSTGIAKIDTEFESIEEQTAVNGRKIRDAVARPASSISAVAAGIHYVRDYLNSDEPDVPDEDEP